MLPPSGERPLLRRPHQAAFPERIPGSAILPLLRSGGLDAGSALRGWAVRKGCSSARYAALLPPLPPHIEIGPPSGDVRDRCSPPRNRASSPWPLGSRERL